jgi:aminoglycoside phosphotransferase (APT) family kinase protein
MTNADPRQTPTPDFISGIRRRFPVEQEIDRILTRKMERRGNPGYSPVSLDDLVRGTTALIARHHGSGFKLDRARWLTGGASKIQMAFDLEWDGPTGNGRTVTPMVLRMEPPESVVETSRAREFELLQAVQDILPVPPCFWVDPLGESLPYPALIYGFAEGVTKPTNLPSTQVTGIGLNYGPEFRPRLALQFLEQIGRVHKAGPELQDRLSHFDRAETGSNAAVIRQVNWWRRVWEEDRKQDDPLMEVTYNWLIRNAPPLDHISVVHGDCRGGNFLFTEHDVRITAWLDWELAYLGDRHHDLAWSTMNPFCHMAEDGKTELVSGLLPLGEYLETYERLSGLGVDRKRLSYYRVLTSYVSLVICMATGYRVVRGGKTHQDIVVSWLAMVSHSILEQLRATLEEVI